MVNRLSRRVLAGVAALGISACGFHAGDSIGYKRGFQEGQASGYAAGHENGFKDGYIEAGPEEADVVEPIWDKLMPKVEQREKYISERARK